MRIIADVKLQGSETNTPTIGWAMFFLAQRPDIQKIAYDAITGSGALDGGALELEGEVPYIMGFTKEVLRFYTPLRLAMPKATTEDVEWEGAKIPKGAMVFLNAWALNRGILFLRTHEGNQANCKDRRRRFRRSIYL